MEAPLIWVVRINQPLLIFRVISITLLKASSIEEE